MSVPPYTDFELARRAAALKTLTQMDFTYHGGEVWKPPVKDMHAELAEADRRAGAAERKLQSATDELAAFYKVRDKMKDEWGADRMMSFDIVWKEAVEIKKKYRELQQAMKQISEIVK